MIVDFINYLAISVVSFALSAFIWRTVFKTFHNWIDRFLFWGTVVGIAIMLAGLYHVFTGDRSFGRVLMLLALAEAVVVMVTVNLLAARAYSKPYDPEQDPEFMAEVAARRQRIEAGHQQWIAEHRPALTNDASRLTIDAPRPSPLAPHKLLP